MYLTSVFIQMESLPLILFSSSIHSPFVSYYRTVFYSATPALAKSFNALKWEGQNPEKI
jgi:hypothetical protein